MSIRIRKLISILIAFLLCFFSIPLQSNNVYASTRIINGKSVSENSVAHQGTNGCVKYAMAMYKIIWGSSYTNSFSESINMLRNLSDSELTLTAEHLKKYVSAAPIGSVLRVSTPAFLHSTDGWGHSVIIVDKSETGFTVFENWNSGVYEHTYTWQSFIDKDTDSSTTYIKYIKWPGATPYNEIVFPTKSMISIPKTEYSLGETITFTFSSDTATYYTIGIDNTAGRYKTEGMSSTSYSISSLPSGSYSAYVTASNSAGWCDSSRVNFTVGITATLNANGGSCTTASKRVVNGLTYGTLPDASKNGYTFAGWYTAQTGGTQVLSSTKVTATANHTLYAHWTANPVTVTLNANGGSVGTTSKTVTYNSTYGTLPDPIRTGYTFAGWYTAKDGGTKVTSSTTVSNASAHTLYAHWTANTYSVSFNSNSGTGSMSDQKFTYDQTANLTANAFTKTGYTFAGWNTKADGSGTSYADKASVKNLAASGTVTLYARWTANKYTVKFDGNGADELSKTSMEVTYNSVYGEFPEPKREGYNFIGWYTQPEGGTAISSDTKVTITSTQTLYAQWSVNKFLITFNATGGTSESAQKLVTYDKAYGVLPTAERTGYTFKGWYLDEACTQQITSDTIVALTANQSVYAKWELRRYVITFDATGGTAETGSKQVTYGKAYGVLPSATKDGDEFIGWFTEDGIEITSASIVEIDSDITLYAKWASDDVIGDVNADGAFNVADVVMMQKWLLCAGGLTDWQAGDLCRDDRIDVFDLCLMKRLLIEKER